MQLLLCRLIVTQVNLRPGHDINSVQHRWNMYMFPRLVCVPAANERVNGIHAMFDIT